MAEKNPAFAAQPHDTKDVSWALATADTHWKRGERSEALRWLRRAVEAASEAEQDERALELAKVAADLATHIGSIAPAPNPTIRSVAIPRASSVAPPAAPKATPPLTTRSPLSKEPPKRADRKSITNEAMKARPPQAPHTTRPADKSSMKPSELPPARKRSSSRVDKAEAPVRLSRTDEIDAWPTDVVPGTEMPASLTMATAPFRDVPVVQAVKVMVWRESDGTVRVRVVAKGSEIPRHAVEATLVASDPSTSLATLFAP